MRNIFIVIVSDGWLGIARLPKALKDEGFNVITLSPQNQTLNKSSFIDFKYTYSNRWEFRNKLVNICKKHHVDLIIPGCDFTVNYFCQISLTKNLFNKQLQQAKEIIKQSWNNVEAYNLLGDKTSLQKIAVKYDILNPKNMHLRSKKELLEEIRNRAYPIVIKESFGAAGLGVRICYNFDDVLDALKILKFNSLKLRFKYCLTSTFGNILALPYGKINFGLSIQNYIEGTPCMHLVLASNGEILSSVTLLKERCHPNKTSPSSVVKVTKHDQIVASCKKIVKETNVSGFLSFDFMIDKNNNPYLLECNPRPTPVTHLSHLCGGNVIAMLKKHLSVNDNNLVPYLEPKYEYIALFPNELKRDPNSQYLKIGYHDIPFDDQTLLESLNKDLVKLGIPPVKKES